MDSQKARALLSTKPELVNSFPDWMLPATTIERLRNTEGVAIAEIAGRDSVAAALAAVERHPIRAVLPTIAYTGTEYGDWGIPLEKSRYLAQRLGESGIEVTGPVLLGAPRFWWLLCGRHISSLIRRFSFYTPCLGCHLYLHALRIPLARLVGAGFVIGGSRESHDGRIKVNQTATALDAYVKFVREFGIELLLPLRHMGTGEEIERIVGRNWDEGGEQLQCVLSGNYRDTDGAVVIDEGDVQCFFDEFALPLAEEIVRDYLAGRSPARLASIKPAP
ncbi:MAG TPA: hypothetical protein G4O13_05225 [Dehalococcoidia bacterium]|nr:hypothetical protein [Dehalococcoidia bacterium]